MLIRVYQKLKTKIEVLRSKSQEAFFLWKVFYKLRIFFLYILILIISLPQYIFLGPTASFELFARREPSGMWLDSYTEYVFYHKITLTGILFVVALIIWGLIVYFFFPVLFFEITKHLSRIFGK